MLVSGAGYKTLMTDVAAICKKDYGLEMQMSFGNFGQMLAQIQNTRLVQAVVSSDNFFTDYKVETSALYPIGEGTLVLAWRRGLNLSQAGDITRPEVRRLAIPHTKKALYGRAGMAFLQNNHLAEMVQNKLYVVSTVPRVTSYIVAGEVDAGFVNLTDIQKVKDKIGGYLPIRTGYPPIHIVTGILKGQTAGKALALYRRCMNSVQVQQIASQHGL